MLRAMTLAAVLILSACGTPASSVPIGSTPRPTILPLVGAPSTGATVQPVTTAAPTIAATAQVTAVPTAEPTSAPTAAPPPAGNCAASYPDFCIPPPPPDLNCADVAPHKNFTVLWNVPDPDPHHFDANKDGIGCAG